MRDHESPCPGLVVVQNDIKGHERELGGIDAKLESILKGQEILFSKTKELCEIATRNETNIEAIQKDQTNLSNEVTNGLKDEIAKSVVAHTKEESGAGLEHRFQEIEHIMWLPRMIDTKVKKWVVAGLTIAILAGIIIITAFASASMWGYFKTTKWGETPGLMQNIEKGMGTALDEYSHFHIIDGKVVVHLNTHMNAGAGEPKAMSVPETKSK
jgi:hypothetical protein